MSDRIINETIGKFIPDEREYITAVEGIGNLGLARIMGATGEGQMSRAGNVHTVALVGAAGMGAGAMLGDSMSEAEIKEMADRVAQIFTNSFRDGLKNKSKVMSNIAQSLVDWARAEGRGGQMRDEVMSADAAIKATASLKERNQA